jgi:hypothetical protein
MDSITKDWAGITKMCTNSVTKAMSGFSENNIWRDRFQTYLYTKFKVTMKNILVAFLLTAFIGSGYIAKASSAYTIVVKEDDKDKKDKKSCDAKKSCCKMKSGEAKACAGMTKTETDAPATATATTAAPTEGKAACSGEKKACCKKKAACTDKEKSDKGATL